MGSHNSAVLSALDPTRMQRSEETAPVDEWLDETPVALIRLPGRNGDAETVKDGQKHSINAAFSGLTAAVRPCLKQLQIKKQAARGNFQASCSPAEQLQGREDPRALRKAARQLRAAAEQGCAEAMLALGCLLLENEEIRDPEQAFFLLVKAGELLPEDQVEQIADCLQRYFYCGNAREETETERPSAENEHTILPSSGG